MAENFDVQDNIRNALEVFYNKYQLGEDGGNHLPYVTLEFGNFFKFYIPNWDGRRSAVLRHDIHHIITGYESKLLGEFEIAAWEIASGCTNYTAAYLLNSGGLLAGLIFHTRASSRAFLRGCFSGNLYLSSSKDFELLECNVSDLIRMINLPQTEVLQWSFSNLLRLAIHIISCFILQLLLIFLLPFLLIFHFYTFLKLRYS